MVRLELGAVGTDHTVKVSLAPTLPTMRAQFQNWYRTRHYQAMIDWMLSPATGYTFTGTSPSDWAQENKQMAADAMPLPWLVADCDRRTAVLYWFSRVTAALIAGRNGCVGYRSA